MADRLFRDHAGLTSVTVTVCSDRGGTVQGVVLAGAHPTSKAAVTIAVPSPTAVSTLPDPDGLHTNGKYLAIGRSEGIDRDAKNCLV